MEEIILKLHPQEVSGLVALLGKLPTETNVWPLAVKIQEQLNAQVQPPAQEEVPVEE